MPSNTDNAFAEDIFHKTGISASGKENIYVNNIYAFFAILLDRKIAVKTSCKSVSEWMRQKMTVGSS
jgi:hypothetical protein